MNNKFNEANLIPRMAQIVLNSQEMKDIKEKIEAVGDDVESILDDMESILNGVSTRFPDHVLAKEGDDTKLVSISRLIELMAIYQLDPLKEDPSRIWFEIDVATSGDFRMEFSGGRAWLDTTELTSNVAVPDVVGKHVVIIEESVTTLDISNNRLKGDLTINGLTSVGGTLYCFYCTSLTALSAPMATYLECSGCTSLTALSAPMATTLHCFYCTSLTTLSAPMATTLLCGDCTSLTTLSAPMATYLNCGGCALTATSIASILADAVLLPDLSDISLDLSGGTNAPYSAWSQQAQDDFATLQDAGWVITYNQ